MDPSLRSSLCNQMMRAMELGEKCTVNKIKSLIRNFHPDSPVSISFYVPSFEDDFIPNISPPSSSNSDSPVMPRSSKPGGSKRRTSRAPRESLLDAQTTVDSDVEDHQQDRLYFSLDRPCSFDTEVNVVGENELRKYRNRFEIPDSMTLMLPGNRAAWNPPENTVAIYGDMLSCGVTLPLQPFIARWKNSWFFVGGKWGRDVSARGHLNLAAKKVPRHFTSPDAWSKATPVLLDVEISHLAATAVLPLDERGHPFLLDEDKMIAKWLFSRLPARLPRLCDFDTVCDLQARAVKNSEAASKRHAAGLSKEGIASPDGGDPSDGEEAGDITKGGVESGAAPCAYRGCCEYSCCSYPQSASRGKHPAEGTPDHAVRPPKRASRVVQYVVSSDEEGADEPVLVETPSAQTAAHEGPAEEANAAVPSSEEADELHVPASTPPQTASPSQVASPPVAMGEPDVSLGQPQLSDRSKSADRPGPSKQPGVFASGSGVAHEAPPVGSNEAGERTVSLSDFSATEICSHLINNDVYIGKGW
ncbi:hypothetical protein LWI29_005032 [Acer saccharum]|uniref:Uncharacterized protein n=1 Tax=Acer saccharum TaxID=4024 RepID=A0AA39TLB8_ACESA|nr:hypothetical protein LWI29_005032 [Acer saccharum]